MLRRFLYLLPKKKASILVVCLWALAVLSILGMGLSSLVFQEMKFASHYWRSSFSLPIARSAVKAIFYERDADDTLKYDTLDELALEHSVDLCNGRYKYYFVDKISPEDNTQIIDEGALVNLNTASVDVLRRLPGVDELLAENIAHSGFKPFSSLNEVFLVEGMSRDNFKQFKDYVTVFGDGKININTASKTVLVAVGLDEGLVDIILRFRKMHEIEVPKGFVEKKVEHGFSSAMSILDDLRGFSMLSLRQEQDLLSLMNVLDVKSAYLRFNVICEAGKKQGVRYSIVICPATKKVLSWKEF